MSFFLPLLLAGALLTPATSSNTNIDDKLPRGRRVVIDTAAHRQVAADMVIRAKVAAESGSLNEARAQLMVANMMLRESGGLQEAASYNLAHVNFALDRYVEAGEVLNELSEEALKRGNVTLAAKASIDAAELFSLAGSRPELVAAIVRARSLLNDSRIPETDRTALRKRVG